MEKSQLRMKSGTECRSTDSGICSFRIVYRSTTHIHGPGMRSGTEVPRIRELTLVWKVACRNRGRLTNGDMNGRHRSLRCRTPTKRAAPVRTHPHTVKVRRIEESAAW